MTEYEKNTQRTDDTKYSEDHAVGASICYSRSVFVRVRHTINKIEIAAIPNLFTLLNHLSSK